jgi:hypothetical protein
MVRIRYDGGMKTGVWGEAKVRSDDKAGVQMGVKKG